MYRVRKNLAGFVFADESKSSKSTKIWRLENLALYGRYSFCNTNHSPEVFELYNYSLNTYDLITTVAMLQLTVK